MAVRVQHGRWVARVVVTVAAFAVGAFAVGTLAVGAVAVGAGGVAASAPSAGTASAGTASAGTASAGAVAAPSEYEAPVSRLRVLRAFDPGAWTYGPGHRGVDLAAAEGSIVRAAAPGRVTFAGRIAGRGIVVVAHADGVRTEYEPVQPSVQAGQTVIRGQPIAVVRGGHAGCRASCLHWGARRGPVYFDPLVLLRALGPVRLLPWVAVPR